ncbi:hypothetical protein [Streptomyces sp. NBC_01789]|uniref:hypothetical protein n=1 Tax=Streptomyces sp. NBC_01789 TaxID=2975941 RepID=UPI0022575577|nr:hypothetical protein [Streptomyces sp. NBC_01789]MCX4451637.1 hypothetical protein [Streptomyces sp. NBC_01789]
MPVNVTKTGGHSVEITWTPEDDPHGLIARAIERDQLADVLQSLGRGVVPSTEGQEELAARHTIEFGKLMDRRGAAYVLHLRETYGTSWRKLAEFLLGDPERQSAVRRMYESGRRNRGI